LVEREGCKNSWFWAEYLHSVGLAIPSAIKLAEDSANRSGLKRSQSPLTEPLELTLANVTEVVTRPSALAICATTFRERLFRHGPDR